MEFILIDQSLIDRRIDRTNRVTSSAQKLKNRISTFAKQFDIDILNEMREEMGDVEPIQTLAEPVRVEHVHVEPVHVEPVRVEPVAIVEPVEITTNPLAPAEPQAITDQDIDDILNGIDFDDIGMDI